MTKKPKAADALVGRRARINDNAYANAGMEGVIEKANGRGDYEITFGNGTDGEFTAVYELADFTVLPASGEAIGAGGEFVNADPYLVAFSLTNPRKRRGLDIDSLNGLAANIKAIGLGQPILVRPLPGTRAADTFEGREANQPLPIYELVCGERRLRACRIAGLTTMPMLVRDLTDDQALELQLVENIEREDLDAMEEAEGFEALRLKCGYSVEQIAERIGQGKGTSYVYKTMKLLALTPDSREAMYDGHLGRSTGLLVARYPAAMQPKVVAFIKSQARNGEPAPFRAVAPQIFTRFNLGLSTAVFSIADAKLVPECGACTTCPKRTGAHADLFGDDIDDEDSCTDPDCFEGKRQAHVAALKKDAEKHGITVIDGEAAKGALPSPWSYMHGFAALDATAWTEPGNDGVEREVTYEDALRKLGKKAPKPQLLINPHTGAGIKVIPADVRDQLDALAPDAGTDDHRVDDDEQEHDDRPPERQALDDFNVHRAVLIRMFDAIRMRERSADELRLAVKALVIDQEGTELMQSYLGWPSPDDSDLSVEEFNQEQADRIDAMTPEQLGQVLAMAAAEVAGITEQIALAQHYGVDILAVRDKVAEDLEQQETEDLDAEREDEEAGATA